MEIKDFVAQSLQQIVEGIAAAQAAVATSGAVINPSLMGGGDAIARQGILQAHGGGATTMVDFDVAVTVSEGTGTRGGIGVFAGVVNLGSSGESSNQNQSVSRLKFRVPLALPLPRPRA